MLSRLPGDPAGAVPVEGHAATLIRRHAHRPDTAEQGSLTLADLHALAQTIRDGMCSRTCRRRPRQSDWPTMP
jgi:hypothetical protein